MTISFQSAQFIFAPRAYPLLTTSFYLELILSQENVLLHVLAQTCGLQYHRVY